MSTPQVSKDDPTPNRSGKANVQPNDPDARVALGASVSKVPPSYAEYKITCQTEKDWWDRHKRWAEIGGVVLLGVYTAYTIKMYGANKTAADAATNAARTAATALVESNRSWIEIQLDRYWMETENNLPRRNEHLRDLRKLAFNLSYTNIGKFPVTGIYIVTDVDVPESDQPPSLLYKKTHYEMVRNILFPGQSGTVPANLYGPMQVPVELDNALRSELASGKRYIAIYAQASFSDAFGEHYVRFCVPLAFNDQRTYSFRQCIDYNLAGDGHLEGDKVPSGPLKNS